MRSVLGVLAVGAVLAATAPMALASENVDNPALTSAGQPARVTAEASDGTVAGHSAPSLPYGDLRQENYRQ